MIDRKTPTDLEQAWRRFTTFLKQRGDRATEARRLVLKHALLNPGHFRADDLATGLADGADRVSRGTVYRTLSLLVEAGLLGRLNEGTGADLYEHVTTPGDHHHLVCSRCGRRVEFVDPTVVGRLEHLCTEHGFETDDLQLVAFATCRRCRGTRTKKPRHPSE